LKIHQNHLERCAAGKKFDRFATVVCDGNFGPSPFEQFDCDLLIDLVILG
jgi:hypothetical protein